MTILAGKKKCVFGALCVKITRKGMWIVFDREMARAAVAWRGELLYMPAPRLLFRHEPRDALKAAGWSGDLCMCELEPFLELNAGALSAVDEEEYRLHQAGGGQTLAGASMEDLERMLAARKKEREGGGGAL